MGWAEKFEGKDGKELWVYSTGTKHRHEAALIPKVEKALDAHKAGNKPWTVRSQSYTTGFQKIAKLSDDKAIDIADLSIK